MTGIIYKATNKKTNKCYVGQTIQPFGKRKKNHINNAKNPNSPAFSTKFSEAIRKFGENAFKWSIVHCNVDRDKLDAVEKNEIDKTNSVNNGYNSRPGRGTKRSNGNFKHMAVSKKIKSIFDDTAHKLGYGRAEVLNNIITLAEFLVDSKAVSVKAVLRSGEEKEVLLSMLIGNK